VSFAEFEPNSFPRGRRRHHLQTPSGEAIKTLINGIQKKKKKEKEKEKKTSASPMATY
jgi:hypothetical protein